MKPVEAINTMIKLTRSPSASPLRPSPGSAHSPRSVERREHLTSKKLDNFYIAFMHESILRKYKMMRDALLHRSVCEVK